MKHTRYIIMVWLGILALISCGGGKGEKAERGGTAPHPSLPVDTALRRCLAEFAQKPRVQGQFGLAVYDLTADKPLFAHEDRRPIPTASCMKLLSGVAGLHLLGTRYKYATSLYTRGIMRGDTLVGDIAFKGGLDPQLQEQDLRMFADALHRKGIRHLNGRLIMDLAIDQPVKAEEHWYPWDLSFSKYGILYKGAPRIRTALRRSLQARGLRVTEDQTVMGRVPSGSHCIFRYLRSIDRVIDRMWKNSSNTQATALLYTIGHRANPKADPATAGVNYLRTFLADTLRQRDAGLAVHDGCGLCTHNQLSPHALNAILVWAWKRPAIRQMLLRHLAVSGEDGTLRRLLADPRLHGKVHGKTGTLSHPYGISSLAGVCKGADGHWLAFTIMDSEMSVLDARVLQRELCKMLTGVRGRK